MKSITTKLRCCVALLLMSLFSITSYGQTEGVPTQEEINELISSPSSQILSNYFQSQGYTNTGIEPGSAHTFEAEEDDLTTGRSSIGAGGATYRSPFRIRIRIVIIIIIHRRAGAEPIAQSVSVEKRQTVTTDGAVGNLTSDFHAVAENTSTDYTVAGGTVLSVAKSVSSFIAKFTNCWNRYFNGVASNCTACYNCLKSCLSGSSWWGSKLWCVLWNCSGKCFKCISSVYQFYKCVTA